MHTAGLIVLLFNRYLEQYNAVAKTPLDLVFFEHANKHIARLCRILRIPGGHALLLGSNGSGQTPMSRRMIESLLGKIPSTVCGWHGGC